MEDDSHNGPFTGFCFGNDIKIAFVSIYHFPTIFYKVFLLIVKPFQPSPLAQLIALLTWEQGVPAWFDPWLGQYSFRGWMKVIATRFIPLSAVRCFNNGYVGKMPVA